LLPAKGFSPDVER